MNIFYKCQCLIFERSVVITNFKTKIHESFSGDKFILIMKWYIDQFLIFQVYRYIAVNGCSAVNVNLINGWRDNFNSFR